MKISVLVPPLDRAIPARRWMRRRAAPFCALFALLLVLLPAASVPAVAHSVDHRVAAGEASVVTLSAGGQPLADASYRVYSPEPGPPFAAGRTDRLGRVSFLPDRAGAWRVVVSAADGHGASVVVTVDEAGEVSQVSAAGPSRPARIAAGVGYLLGVAGLLALWKARR